MLATLWVHVSVVGVLSLLETATEVDCVPWVS